jgi:hypothetical protein
LLAGFDVVAKCRFQSIKVRPQPGAAIGDLMQLCMRGEGYGFSVASHTCEIGWPGSSGDPVINPACYQSKLFLRFGTSLPSWAYDLLKDY